MSKSASGPYVSRGGQKLAAALVEFGLDVSNLICADLGSHVGGFVDCLLSLGAQRVYSVDTSYGTLAWKLRRDPRVVVHERTNAIHVELPPQVQFVTIDVGWTRQDKVLPNVARWVADDATVVTLIKPHYEALKSLLVRGVLPESHLEAVVAETLDSIAALGWKVEATMDSPLIGHGGNREVLAQLSRRAD